MRKAFDILVNGKPQAIIWAKDARRALLEYDAMGFRYAFGATVRAVPRIY